MKGSEIFVMKYLLDRWGEEVMDQWNHIYKTEVVFVDELPKNHFYGEDNPEDYTGSCTMCPFGSTVQVTKSMAWEKSSYHAGAAGYLEYLDTIYVLKGTKVMDIEKEYPFKPAIPEEKKEHLLKFEEVMFFPPKKVEDVKVEACGFDREVEGSWYEVTVFIPGYVDNTAVRVFKDKEGIYWGDVLDASRKVWSRASSDIRALLLNIVMYGKEEDSVWRNNLAS